MTRLSKVEVRVLHSGCLQTAVPSHNALISFSSHLCCKRLPFLALSLSLSGIIFKAQKVAGVDRWFKYGDF